MIKFLIKFLIICNSSYLFMFFAGYFGISLQAFSLISMFFFTFFTFKNWFLLNSDTKKILKYFLIIMWLWPIFSIFISLEVDLRLIVLNLFYWLLISSTVIFIIKYGLHEFMGITKIVVLLVTISIIVSAFIPNLFLPIAKATQNNIFFYGRGYGFFMQPNLAAYGIIFCYFPLFLYNKSNTWFEMLIHILALSALLLTGSRGGFISYSLLILMRLIFIKDQSKSVINKFILGFKMFILLVILILPLLWIKQDLMEKLQIDYFIDRIASINNLFDNEKFEDNSYEARIRLQAAYLDKIKDKPFFGYGMGSNKMFREAGIFELNSHNFLVERFFLYGIFYLLFFYFILFTLYRMFSKKSKNEGRIILIVIVITTFTALSTHMLLDLRTFLCCVGFLIALLNTNQIKTFSNKLEYVK